MSAIIKPLIGIAIVLLFSFCLAWAGSQGSKLVGEVPIFFLCAGVSFLSHWLIFLPSFAFQTEHYFDLTGSISYLAVIGIAILASPELGSRAMVLCLIVALWTLRLGSFLFHRVKKIGADRRFREIKKRFFRYLFTWTLGGAWVFITLAAALAAITSRQQTGLDAFFAIGMILWMVGFTIEVVADYQKSRFRRQPGNSDIFITTGLWSRSRHPNYFGEIMLWTGIAIIAFPALTGWQYLTLISPIFVAFILIKVSGIPLLEASADSRWEDNPAYQRYVANTPVLVPRLR